MLKKLLVVAIIGGVLYQYPGLVGEATEMLGWDSGSACGATKNYFRAIANDELSEADKYKMPGDSIPEWVDELDNTSSVECGCTEDVGETALNQVEELPEELKSSLNNLTEARLVLFTIEGGYDGTPSTLRGGALVFSMLSPGWFVTQEGYYELNNESNPNINIGQLSTECYSSEA